MFYVACVNHLTLAEKILEHQVFKEVYDEYVRNRSNVTKDFVVEKMKPHQLYGIETESTFQRRASTIIGWVKWICELPNRY
jgi:hypothetical protein